MFFLIFVHEAPFQSNLISFLFIFFQNRKKRKKKNKEPFQTPTTKKY